MAIKVNPNAETIDCKTDWKYTTSTSVSVLDYTNHQDYSCAGENPMHIALQWEWDTITNLAYENAYFGYRVRRTPVTVPDPENPCKRKPADAMSYVTPSYQNYDPTILQLKPMGWDRSVADMVKRFDPDMVTDNPCSDEQNDNVGWSLVADIIVDPINFSGTPYCMIPHVEWYNGCTGTFRKVLAGNAINSGIDGATATHVGEFVEDLSEEMGCCVQGTKQKFAYQVEAMIYKYNSDFGFDPLAAQTRSDCVVAKVDCCKYITASDIEVTASCAGDSAFDISLWQHVSFTGYPNSLHYAKYMLDYYIEFVGPRNKSIEACWLPHSQQESNSDKEPIDKDYSIRVDPDFGNNDGPFGNDSSIKTPELDAVEWIDVTRQDWVNQRILDMLNKYPIPVPTPQWTDVWGSNYTFPQTNFVLSQVPANNNHFVLKDQFGTYLKFIFDTSKSAVERKINTVFIPMQGVSNTANSAAAIVSAINHADVREMVNVNYKTRRRLRMTAKVNPANTSCVLLMMVDPGEVKTQWKALSFSSTTGIADVEWQQFSARTNLTNPAIEAFPQGTNFAPGGDATWTFENNCCCDDVLRRSNDITDDCPDNRATVDPRHREPCCGVEWYKYTVYDPFMCCGATGSIKIIMPPAALTNIEVQDYGCTDESNYGTNRISWDWSGNCVHRFKVFRTETPDVNESWEHIGTKYTTTDPVSGSAWFADDCGGTDPAEGLGSYWNRDLYTGNKYLQGSTASSTTSKEVYAATQIDIDNADGATVTCIYNDPADNFPSKKPAAGTHAKNPTTCTGDTTYWYKVIPCCLAVSASLEGIVVEPL